MFMSQSFKFTVIVPSFDNDKQIKDFLDSIHDDIQLIFVNEENFSRFKGLNVKNAFILNNDDPMENICGDYIHFLDVNNNYSDKLFNSVSDFILKNDDLNIVYCENKERIIDLNDKPYISVTDISKTFINRHLMDSQIISEILNGCDFYYLNKLLNDNKRIGTVYVNLEKNNYRIITKEYFSNRISQYKKILVNLNSDFIQHNVISDLNGIITDDSFKQMEGQGQFRDDLNNILKDINDNIIKKHDKVNKNIKRLLIYLKTEDFHSEIKKGKVLLKSGNHIINSLQGHFITFDIVEIRDDFLNVSGMFKSSCDPDFLDFQAVLKYHNGDKNTFTAVKNEYPTTHRARESYFGFDWIFYPCFDFNIPIKANDEFKIEFYMGYHENDKKKILKMNRFNFSRLCNLSKLSNYFVKDNHIVLFRDNAIHVVNSSFLFRLKLELNSIKTIINSGEKYAWYSIQIRIIYFILYIFWKNKRIWLFEDRLLIADDNAKHLFLHALGRNDEVEKYFVLDKNSKDFNKMKKISNNVIAFGSLKHKMLYLFGEKFISSHRGHELNPFHEYNEKLFCGLTTIQSVFLQHGITMHEVSFWLKKFGNNFRLFVAASDYERDSLLHPNYNFSPDTVKTLGFPRFDNLNNNNLKKQILFMPTWRKTIHDEDDFLNSSYYHDIESFFNNERLLDILKSNAFKIVFKPHFETLEYIHLFNIPEEVELNVDDSYQTLFNESMILITDYSSVFFDFAYLKKPVIYYRDNTRFHYDEGYFDFETMGFGEIIKNEDVLVDKIEEYIQNDCKMETKFIKRVDEFFKFNDKNNCKRVYDCLYELK